MGAGVDFGNSFGGRNIIKNVQLTGIDFTPSFAYKVNDRFSLGAGISIIYTLFDQELAVRQPGTSEASIEFEDLDDWGVQGVLGLTYQVLDRVLLGLVYRSEAEVELEGGFKVKNGSDSTNGAVVEFLIANQLKEGMCSSYSKYSSRSLPRRTRIHNLRQTVEVLPNSRAAARTPSAKLSMRPAI